MREVLLVAMVLVCAGPALAAAAGPIKGLGAARRIPARIVAGRLMVVPVAVDGTGPYPFLLDTGGTSTILDETLAARLRLPRLGRAVQETATAARASDLVRATLTLGGVERRDVDVISAPLDAVRALGADIRGVVGQDLLRGANWWLDYRGRALIEDADGALAGSAVGERIAVHWAADRPAVDLSLPDGRPLRMILDSAAGSTVLFREPAARADPVGTARLTTYDGGATVAMVALGPLRVGRVVLPRLDAALVGVASRPEDGLLPTGLFDAVYFDNRAGAVVINPERASASRGR
jgi:predicted aspartyl protease